MSRWEEVKDVHNILKSLALSKWRICVEEMENGLIMKGFERKLEDFRQTIAGNQDSFVILE